MKTKIYTPEQLSFFPLYITSVGVNYKEGKMKRQGGYENHQIFLVHSGCGVLKVGKETFELNKNDLFYLAANIPHEYYAINSNFYTTYISFCGEGFEKIREYYGLGDFGVYKNKNSGVFKACAENLYNSIDSIHEVSTLCALTYSTVISYFDEVCKKHYSPIEEVCNFIEENYSKMITLEDILAIYPYSKTKLCNDFKENYKVTIFEMLTSIRLHHAQNMIQANPHIKLKDVACFCGFNDTSYFCKMYKQFYSCSPKSRTSNK